MKRTWIKVKRGLLEPKHRFALGEAWQLYLFILDITDWETGTIEDWKDKEMAAELEMPVVTLRYQRNRLKEKNYIKWELKQHGLRIIINNWTNPREYSGEVYNQVDNEVNNEVDNQVDNEVVKNPLVTPVPSYSHISHNTYTHNRKYTPHKSYQELKQEKENTEAADYRRFLKSKYVNQGCKT